MIIAVTDTQALLRYSTGKVEKLGKKALRVFQAADSGDGRGFIYIPAVVLVECSDRVEDGSIKLGNRFDHWVRELQRSPFFEVTPITHEIAIRTSQLHQLRDPLDRLITACALELDHPLITDDHKIREANVIEILWDE